MFTALFAKIGVKALAYTVSIIAVVGVIGAGYLYFQHTQNALISAAATNATEKVTEAVDQKSLEVVHAQAVEMNKQIDANSQKNADADAQWGKLFDQTNQIKETNDVPSDTPAAPVAPSTQPLPVKSGNRAIDDLNRASDDVDGLLECASSGTSHCR